MKRILLNIVIIAIFSAKSFAQNEHLIPVRDFSKYKGNLKDYYDSVFLLLYKDFADTPIARYTATPSFDKEYSFSLELIEDRFYIKSNMLADNFWYSKQRNRLKVHSSSTEVTIELAAAIKELFQLLLANTKQPNGENLGTDGTTYYFSSLDSFGKFRTGEIWSPDENTLLHNLTMICDRLFRIGQGRYISQDVILKDILKLTKDFRE